MNKINQNYQYFRKAFLCENIASIDLELQLALGTCDETVETAHHYFGEQISGEQSRFILISSVFCNS